MVPPAELQIAFEERIASTGKLKRLYDAAISKVDVLWRPFSTAPSKGGFSHARRVHRRVSETWREIWLPLIDEPLAESEEGVLEDIFYELYRELAKALKAQPSSEALGEILDDPVQSREAFEKTIAADLAGERAVVIFLEAAHPALDDLGGDELTNRYFNLLTAFIDKFSLRYDLRRTCVLCPPCPACSRAWFVICARSRVRIYTSIG